MFKNTEAEYKKVKSDILRIARIHRRQSELVRSESERSPSPVHHRSARRSRNLPKFIIANFYPSNVELWFNQIETQFNLHCVSLSGEVASDVRDILLQPFHNHLNLKKVLIKRRGLTTPERVDKVISGEKD